jgi:tetratricopeptide (TPR) repeat protein
LRALWGLIHFNLVARRPRLGLEYARRFRLLALERPGQPEIQMSDHLLGWAHLVAGELILARGHFEDFLGSYISPPRSHAALFGYAKRVTAKGGLAVVLWLQGKPEQALMLAEDGLAEAEKLQHMATTFFALGHGACFIALFTGNLDAGRRHLRALDKAVRLVKRWENTALAYRGMIARQDKELPLALDCFERALSGYSPAKSGLLYPFLLLELAQVRCGLGDFDRAEGALELASECRSGPEDVIVVCRALRVKAEIVLARRGDTAVTQAEVMLLESIRIAKIQQAITLELESATSLARLWVSEGRPDEAKRLLRPIVEQFTEGFALPPLLRAQVLL